MQIYYIYIYGFICINVICLLVSNILYSIVGILVVTYLYLCSVCNNFDGMSNGFNV